MMEITIVLLTSEIVIAPENLTTATKDNYVLDDRNERKNTNKQYGGCSCRGVNT